MVCEFVFTISVYLILVILVSSFVYPTMDELGEQVLDVLVHFGLKRVIGFGVGAGANILCRFALAYPEKVCTLSVMNAANWLW